VDATVLGGLAVAALAWAWLFASIRRRFWPHAAAAGTAIGAYGAVAQRSRLGALLAPSVADAAVGVAAAALLYGMFWLGYQLLGRLLPSVADLVGQLYGMRGDTGVVAVVLTLVVVSSCEELFWRGLIQERAGFVLALAGYVAVLVWSRNWALMLAAAVGGAWWGGLFAWRETLVAPIVCHALWDLAVVVWLPLRSRSESR
jgi:membrane protease YdiL (CAAX protease family)